MRVQVVLLVVAASVCTAVVSLAGGLFGGAARFVAGLILALVLPARLAVLALFADRDPERLFLRLTVAVPLGLAVCAVAGAVVAMGFDPSRSALVLLLACVGLAVVALLRAPASTPVGRPSLSWAVMLCAVPALVLTGFVAWRVAVFAGSPGPAYTEFAVDSANSVQVHSHERATRRFRLETSVDGQVSETAEFDLRPGETARFLVAGGGSVRARLYVAGQAAPYRELSF